MGAEARWGSGSLGIWTAAERYAIRACAESLDSRRRPSAIHATSWFCGAFSLGFSLVAARRYFSASGWLVLASIRPRLRLDSKTSGLASTDLRYAAIESSGRPIALYKNPRSNHA